LNIVHFTIQTANSEVNKHNKNIITCITYVTGWAKNRLSFTVYNSCIWRRWQAFHIPDNRTVKIFISNKTGICMSTCLNIIIFFSSVFFAHPI